MKLNSIGLPESIHSARIASVLLVIMGLFYKKKNPLYKKLDIYTERYYLFFLLCLLFFLSFLSFIFIGPKEGHHIINDILNIYLFTIPVVWALLQIFDDIDAFMKVLFYVGIIQSFVIVLCLINANFASALDSFLYVSEKYRELRIGYAGGISCIAAPGAILFFISLIACAYLYMESKKYIYIIFYIYFSIISALIARTGLIFSLLGLGVIIGNGSYLKSIFKFIFIVLILFILAFIFFDSHSVASFIDSRLFRYIYLIEVGVEEAFFLAYFDGETTIIPPLNSDTILGIGMTSGVANNGYIVNVDGGYFRIYAAIGLPFAILFYIFIIRLFYKIFISFKINRFRFFIFIYLIYLLIAEFKEYTILLYYTLTILFVIVILLNLKDKELYHNSITD